MDVGKREDRLLDHISLLTKNRDLTLKQMKDLSERRPLLKKELDKLEASLVGAAQ